MPFPLDPATPRAGRCRRRRFAAALLVAALAACASRPSFVSSPLPAQPASTQSLPLQAGDVVEVRYFATPQPAAQAYRVEVGDTLRVDLADHPGVSRERLLVLPDGSVSLPVAGRLAVVGLTLQEVTDELARRYRQALIHDPRVTVSVVEGDLVVRSLIALGNSSAADANLHEISPNGQLALPAVAPVDGLRPLPELRVAVQQAYQAVFGGRLQAVVNLRRSKPRVVHVIGEVVRPGNVDFQSQINVMTAVASAGGMTASAQPDRVVLVRYHADGSHSQWLLDIERAMNRAEQADARLGVLPGDVIYVPKSGVALANDAVDLYVRRMLPLSVGVGLTVQP
jgi:protein involved in polysaccharide export with SLBB domain